MLVKGSEENFIFLVVLEIGFIYLVGIEFEKVLINLGFDEDMVLCEGDVLFIFKYVSMVIISGVVMYFNIIFY